MHQVYLSIGGNLGNRKKNMNDAIELINEKIGKVEKCSSWYISEPWGFEHAKYFINAVLLVHTKLNPNSILDKCLNIEKTLLRHRRISNSDKNNYEGRTMDIDILFFNDEIINNDKLVIPHPLISQRKFVLLPLVEIAPELLHPILQKNASQLLYECSDNSKVRKI